MTFVMVPDKGLLLYMRHSVYVDFKVHTVKVLSLVILYAGSISAFSLFSFFPFLFGFMEGWVSFRKDSFFGLYLTHLSFVDL